MLLIHLWWTLLSEWLRQIQNIFQYTAIPLLYRFRKEALWLKTDLTNLPIDAITSSLTSWLMAASVQGDVQGHCSQWLPPQTSPGPILAFRPYWAFLPLETGLFRRAESPHQGIWTCKCLNTGVQVTYKKRTISGNVLNSLQWVRADVRCSPPSPSSSWPGQLIHVLDTGLWTVTWHFGKLLMDNAREESLVSTLTHSTSTFMNDFDFIVSHVFLPENGHEQNLLEMH